MIAHLDCEFPGVIEDQLEAALSSWESAWHKAEECQTKLGWEPSFTQTGILYAKSHITLRQKSPETMALFMSAFDHYSKTGRHTYWTGFGTVFFEIVGDLSVRDGGSRLPKGEVGTNGFPFTAGSNRPILSWS
jgi:hypothetical protein